MAENREYKTTLSFIKSIDSDRGIVDHFFSIFGNIDDGRDIVHKGAFTKTLQERAGRIRVLDAHNAGSVMDVIGKPLEIREVGRDELPKEVLDRFPDATGGAFASTQFFLDTPEGLGAFKRIKNEGITEWSFGFDVLQSDMSRDKGTKAKIRNIREVRLYEYSPVLWGMNPATATVSAKDNDTNESGIKLVDDAMLPVAEMDQEWEGFDTEKHKVWVWSGLAELDDDADPEVIDQVWAKYGEAFLRTSDPTDAFAYDLLIATVIDGDLMAVPEAIILAAEQIFEEVGDSTPTDEEAEIMGVLADYYAELEMAPPWEEDEASEEDEAPTGDEETSEESDKAIEVGTFVAWVDDDGETQVGLISELSDEIATVVVWLEDEESGWEATDQEVEISLDDLEEIESLISEDERSAMEREQDLQRIADLVASRFGQPFANMLMDGLKEAEGEGDLVGEEDAADDDTYGLSDIAQGTIHLAFTTLADKWYIAGLVNRKERKTLSGAIGTALDTFYENIPAGLRGRDVGNGYYYDPYYYSANPQAERGLRIESGTKAGRVLSKRNAQKIKDAVATLTTVLIDAGILSEAEAIEVEESDKGLLLNIGAEKTITPKGRINSTRLSGKRLGRRPTGSPTPRETEPEPPFDEAELMAQIEAELESL